MKLIKMSAGKFLDIVVISFFISFMLGISISNFGQYPYTETVELINFIASAAYIGLSFLYIYFCALFRRKRLIIFNAVLFILSMLFSVWYFSVSVTSAALPNALISSFSFLAFLFHSQFIGIYFLIDPIDRVVYGMSSFGVSFALALFALFFLLRQYGYFDKLRLVWLGRPKREKKERLSKVERMKREITEEKKEKRTK